MSQGNKTDWKKMGEDVVKVAGMIATVGGVILQTMSENKK